MSWRRHATHGAGLAGMKVKRPETRMSEQVNDKVVAGWEQLAKGFAHCGVAVDREDRV